jgi:hypothetical protein
VDLLQPAKAPRITGQVQFVLDDLVKKKVELSTQVLLLGCMVTIHEVLDFSCQAIQRSPCAPCLHHSHKVLAQSSAASERSTQSAFEKERSNLLLHLSDNKVDDFILILRGV